MVRSTWSELEARHFVEITSRGHEGAVPSVQLLREDRSGGPCAIPDGPPGETYRRIPELTWRCLFAEPDLAGPGLAMYLVAVRIAYRAQRLDALPFASACSKPSTGSVAALATGNAPGTGASACDEAAVRATLRPELSPDTAER